MESFPQFENEVTISEAVIRIRAILQEEMVKGAIDSEPEQFRKIIADVTAGRVTPNEALEKAYSIASGRQDYH